MQRNRFETYHGCIWFLLEYQLRAVQGDSVKEGHSRSSRGHLFLTIFNTEWTFFDCFAHISIEYN